MLRLSLTVVQYTFASFISRDTTYDVLMNIWRLCNPNAVMSTTSFRDTSSRPASIVDGNIADDSTQKDGGGGAGGKGHAKTECACGKKGEHYSETALETTFPTAPEKAYNLMFASGWFKTFLSDNQKLRGMFPYSTLLLLYSLIQPNQLDEINKKVFALFGSRC